MRLTSQLSVFKQAQARRNGSSAAVATSREGHREWLSVRCATLKPRYRNESEKLSCARPGSPCQKGGELAQVGIRGGVLPPAQGSERKVAPMTVSSPNVIEIKLDRLIDDMRLLRSKMIAFDRHLNGIEAYLKSTEPSEQQPESKSRPGFAAAATRTPRRGV